ncbi:MAG: biosynthetic peptidoglycan transglycosylase [Pseudomonadota bacterium]|nr:biosynthetic peptidoglycan transglycosylase [Pseudomonadota bacterium]
MGKLESFLYKINHSPNFIPSEKIPEHVKKSFVVAEDNFFYTHRGVDYSSLSRAAKILFKTGQKRQGGSTITMQLARNTYLTNKKTYTRKFNEILIARKIENTFSKDDILTLYLNEVYLGHNVHGIKQAAQFYFGKNVYDLNVSEAAILAGIPPAPAHVTPILNPEKIMQKRNEILIRLLALKIITPSSYCISFNMPLELRASH